MPAIVCADGFRLSVQASKHHYCTPRDDYGPWTEVEVGYPSQEEPLLFPYAEDPGRPSEVFAYVPIEVVRRVIKKHGGAIAWMGFRELHQ
ncbi:MAG: hypothetical protein ACPLSY_03375 [Moorellaceae bacterium]